MEDGSYDTDQTSPLTTIFIVFEIPDPTPFEAWHEYWPSKSLVAPTMMRLPLITFRSSDCIPDLAERCLKFVIEFPSLSTEFNRCSLLEWNFLVLVRVTSCKTSFIDCKSVSFSIEDHSPETKNYIHK